MLFWALTLFGDQAESAAHQVTRPSLLKAE